LQINTKNIFKALFPFQLLKYSKNESINKMVIQEVFKMTKDLQFSCTRKELGIAKLVQNMANREKEIKTAAS